MRQMDPGKPVKRAVKRAPKPSPPPVTDVQSSGGNYGIPKAKAYQKKVAKAPKPKANIGQRRNYAGPHYTSDAPARPAPVKRTVTVRDINTGKSRKVSVTYHPLAHPHVVDLSAVPASLLDVVKRAYGQGSGKPDYSHPSRGGGRDSGSLTAMIGVHGASLPAKVVDANVSEAVHNPGPTLKGFGNQVAGTVGAVGQIVLPTLQGHPKKSLQALGRLPAQIAKDYSYRYGPLVKGNDAEYRRRVHKTGAAPGLVDIASAATVGGAVTRPAVRAAIGATKKGDEFLNAARPALRTSGGAAKAQELSHKPSRVVLQRATDKARKVANEKLPSRRPDEQGRVTALQPRKTAVAKSIERHNRKRKATVVVPPAHEEVVPILTGRHTAGSGGSGKAQRLAIGREAARSYIANKHEQTTEINNGALKGLASLTPKQRHATFHVLQGLIPAHGTVDEVRHALADREKQLVEAGAPKGASVLHPHTELATVRYLQKHADEVFGAKNVGRLHAFHAEEIARGKRIAKDDPGLRDATAQARRVRPQGEMLGIKYEPPKATADNALERDAYNHQYVTRVRAAALEKDLPEPTYFVHEKRPMARLSNRTASNLAKAVKGPQHSDMRLFNEGRAITSPEAYARGLADTIKRKHQWPAVAQVIDQHAFDWSKGPDGKGMSVEQIRHEIDKRGLRHEDISMVAPGRVGKKDAILDASDAKSAVDESHPLATTRGYFALPHDAAQELLANTRPSGKGMRVAGRVQGLQSAAILGLNPSWLGMQLAANTLQAGFGAHGNLLDLVKGEPFYKSLSKPDREAVDRHLGVGLFEGQTSVPKLGSHQGNIGAAAERAGQVPIVRLRGKAVRVTDINPIRVMFRADNAQNTFFRRAVFGSEVKRQAFKDLTDNIGHAQTALLKVSDLLRLKPGETVAAQMRRVLADPARVEQAAEYVNDVLGDYLRYSHRERAFKTFVMFYGFLRYATKTLFYTLPVKHPLAAELALKLGQLHDDEVQRIFGTRNVPPWIYSRVFQYDSHGRVIRKPLLDAKGHVVMVNGEPMVVPQSIDLARINPLTGPITDAVEGGPKAVFGLMSPMVQAVANIAATKNLQANTPLTVNGSAEAAKSLSFGEASRVFLNQAVVQPTFPGRLFSPKGAQSDDALPGSPRPITYKSQAAREKDAAKNAARLKGGDNLLQQLAPLSTYKPDTTPIYLAQHGHSRVAKIEARIKTAKAAKKKLLASGHATENGGYATKQYADLSKHITNLEKQRHALLGTKTTKAVRVKRRPETEQQRVDARTARRLKRLENSDQAITDRINKRLERLKVATGG